MLLVLGVRSLYALVSTGAFHCPECQVDRGYRLRRPRAWFHAFWVPLVPLRRGADVVECDVCRSRFEPAVLAVPTAQRLGQLLSQGLRTAAAYLVTAAGPGPEGARRALDVLRRELGPTYTRELFEADLAAHRQGSDFTVLHELAGQLDVLGRERLLRHLADLGLTLADGRRPDWERLGDVAAALGVTPLHLRGIVEAARAGARE